MKPLNTADFHTDPDEVPHAQLANLAAMARSIFHQVAATEVAQPELTTLVRFKGTNGAQPSGSLIADHHGDLSGTTAFGGANGDGTVFEITGSGFSTHKTPSYSVVESHDSFVFAWQRYRILAEPLKPGRLRRSAQDRERKTDCDRDG
jgi:hypothetical protein